MDLGLESLQFSPQTDQDCVKELMFYHDINSMQLITIQKLIDLNVSKEVIQELLVDDINGVSIDSLKTAINQALDELNSEFITHASNEGLWTSLKYAFTSDTKVQKLVDSAQEKMSKFSDKEWDAFLNKKVSTTCFTKQSALDMCEALSKIVSGLVKYYGTINQYGWIFQPDDVQRVKQYDRMQYEAILAKLKPVVETGDKIYAELAKKNKFDSALTGRYQTVKASSLSKLGFDKASVLSMVKQHAKGSAGCKHVVGDLMRMCANYGNDTSVDTSYKVETEAKSDGSKVDVNSTVKRVTEVKSIAKQSYVQITKLAQLAVTIYTPLDKFIYAIAKNV